MINFLTSKKFITFLLIIISVMNLGQFYRTKAFDPIFIESNKDNAIVITFPNDQFLIIRAEADSADNNATLFQHPFAQIQTAEYRVSGVDFGMLTKKHSQIIRTDNNTRFLNLYQKESSIVLEFAISTNYIPTENLKYQLQFDYSQPLIFSDSVKNFIFEDQQCQFVIPKNSDYTYYQFFNDQSFKINQAFDNNINFEIEIRIDCSV